MDWDVTLRHTVDGIEKATKTCTVTADTEEQAIRCALECAGSCQGGMFRTFMEGKHLLTVVAVCPAGQKP